jgi:hypothetical protein
MSKREEGILSRADFTFDRERNLYICPQGKFLRTTGTVYDGKYPPAEPGALMIGPLKAAIGVADATPIFWAT